jgi:YD repeat-containing protein
LIFQREQALSIQGQKLYRLIKASSTGAVSNTFAYTYDAADRLTSVNGQACPKPTTWLS